MHKSTVWTGSSIENITFAEAGTYKIVTYCRDAMGAMQTGRYYSSVWG